jgi:hypothetical protein
LFGEGEFDRFLDIRRFHDSLVRGFWGIMMFDGFGADPFFSHEFYGRAEEVVEESPFVSIEIVEERYDVFFI